MTEMLREQRLDVTNTGLGTAVMLLDAKCSPERLRQTTAEAVAIAFGIETGARGLVSWDVFGALLTRAT